MSELAPAGRVGCWVLVVAGSSWHGLRTLPGRLRSVALGALGVIALVSAPAQARDDAMPAPRSRAATALVTGLAVAGASLAYGGTLLTTGRSLPVKRDGLYVMDTGLTLAPLLAHGVVGEWGRGAVFSVPPALGFGSMVALLAVRPDAPIRGKQNSQRIYPILLSVSVLGSAVGIFDAAFADERAPSLAVAAGGGYVGAELGGRF